jgi:hypothetical protein
MSGWALAGALAGAFVLGCAVPIVWSWVIVWLDTSQR